MTNRDETKRRIMTMLNAGSQSLITLHAKVSFVSEEELQELLNDLIAEGKVKLVSPNENNLMSEKRYKLVE